jgi:hypothetical protein
LKELNRNHAREVGELASQIDQLTNSISDPDWGSNPTSPLASLPCSPRDEIPPDLTPTQEMKDMPAPPRCAFYPFTFMSQFIL